MKLLASRSQQTPEPNTFTQQQRTQTKQALRQQIQEALQTAQNLPADACLCKIKDRLLAIQKYCETVHKTFIVVEETITCDQYDLGGDHGDAATLFRGPSEDASVAICVTQRGSLLYRNGCSWQIYKNVGDIHPVESLAGAKKLLAIAIAARHESIANR